MEANYLKYFCVILCILKVNSMALKGSPLTRYDPCGLGIIYFDKITDNYWQGIVNFGLYRNLVEAKMEIYFENQVVIYGASQKTNFTVRRNSWHDFIIKPIGPIPQQYTFQLTLQENITSIPTILQFALNNVTLCNSDIKAAQTINSFNVTKNHKGGYAHMCGRRSLNNTELVSVRTEARAGDWPWHVAILVKDPKTNTLSYQCGGSIISRNAIITAGHCFFKQGLVTADRIIVIAGTNNYKDVNQIGRQSFIASEVIIHPSYNHVDATSDLAIIKVQNLRYTEYVQPICIWGPVYDKTHLFGLEATVVGFGKTENNTLSDTLRASYTIVQNDTVCIAYSSKVYTKLMNEFTFCAGYGPKSGINPRNGDSGGGLVLATMQPDHKISWFLRGVLSKCGVSPGQTECDPKFYVVYTDVGPHYGWIYHHSGLKFRNNVM